MDINALKIVVTGAGSGMGRHFAARLLEEGAAVSAWDLSPEGLSSLAAAHPDGRLHCAAVDVSDEAQVERAMSEAWSALGGLNGLVNNAGIFRDALLVKRDRESGALREMSLAQWQQVIDVDLTGPFLCTRALSRRLLEAKGDGDGAGGGGLIVNISSISRAGNMGQSNYSAAKAGLIADTVTWAKELAPAQIRVAAIAPGFVATPILEGMRPELVEKMVQRVPLQRLGSPEEIYQGLRFIIQCDYFTGRCLDIDGGLRI